jgi:myo-inositol-1-phosphate synthase
MVAAAPSSGSVTPDSVENVAPIHPTAVRRPYPIVVRSETTNYSEEHITSTFTNRGADIVTTENGQFIVTPKASTYELQTQRAVSKTG